MRDDALRELTYTARELSGSEAQALGLVTRLEDDPLAAALDLADTIASRNPDAVRAAKRLFNHAADQPFDAILLDEATEQQALLGSPNQREAVAAGMEKRAARFVNPKG